jgi:WhiB family redox-sensing transcriptional regulator
MVTPRRPDRLDVDGGTAELRDLRALVDLRPAWWAHAACRGAGVALFFLEPRQQPTEARTYCARCPVTDVCLAVAMETDAAGIWAGTTPTERRAMRRRTTTTTEGTTSATQ